MHLFIGVCALVTVACSAVPYITHLQSQGDQNESENNIKDNPAGARMKRAIPVLIRALLKRAQLIYPGKGYNMYGKPGGYTQAVKDVYELKPTNVANYGTSKWGDVGERTIVVQLHDKKATLTILKRTTAPDGDVDPIVTNIVYRDNLLLF